MKWSPEEEEVLKKCFEKGLTINQITKILPARTHDSIANKSVAMGLMFNSFVPPQIDYDAFKDLTGEVLDI